MKTTKILVTLIVLSLLFVGCGKTESISNSEGTSEQRKENINVQGDNVEQIAITTYEELGIYESARIDKIISAFEDSGVSYELTDNQKYLYNLETSYQVLNKEYKINQIGYSMYDSNVGAIDTVVSFEYEFHPEKGLSIDDANIKLLYAFIQTTDNAELKEKYKTCEDLVTGLTDAVNSGTMSTIYDIGNSRLVLEVQNESKYIIEFAEVDKVSCNIEQPEQVYMEFDSYDEYQAFINHGLTEGIKEYILSKDERVIDTTGGNNTEKLTDSETLHITCNMASVDISTLMTDNMRVDIWCRQNRDNIDNNFELFANLSVSFDDDHFELAESYVRLAIEYLKEENILSADVNVNDCISDIMSQAQMIKRFKVEHSSIAEQWFDLNSLGGYEMYSQVIGKDNTSSKIIIPVKVEGLLNG